MLLNLESKFDKTHRPALAKGYEKRDTLFRAMRSRSIIRIVTCQVYIRMEAFGTQKEKLQAEIEANVKLEQENLQALPSYEEKIHREAS